MNKYGKAAVKAVKLIHSNKEISPMDAWNEATIELFGEGTHPQKKGCPRSVFIGLCEEGHIVGINKGIYFSRKNSGKNKEYAIRAVDLIQQDYSLTDNTTILWDKVVDGKSVSHNHQMDVVLSLWKSGFIKKEEENVKWKN